MVREGSVDDVDVKRLSWANVVDRDASNMDMSDMDRIDEVEDSAEPQGVHERDSADDRRHMSCEGAASAWEVASDSENHSAVELDAWAWPAGCWAVPLAEYENSWGGVVVTPPQLASLVTADSSGQTAEGTKGLPRGPKMLKVGQGGVALCERSEILVRVGEAGVDDDLDDGGLLVPKAQAKQQSDSPQAH